MCQSKSQCVISHNAVLCRRRPRCCFSDYLLRNREERGHSLVGLLQIKQIILPMWNGLPKISQTPTHDEKESSRDKKHRQVPEASYRGITLKEYFRLRDQNKPNETLKQIKQQSRASSSHSSFAETPTFNQEDNKSLRTKIKTEACQPEHQHNLKSTLARGTDIEMKAKVGLALSLQKNQKGPYYPLRKKQERKKVYTKIHSQPNKEQLNVLNRSTLNSFYQVEENKKRMLKKIQQEKDRTNDLRLSEAFFITKYGSRFRIEPTTVKRD